MSSKICSCVTCYNVFINLLVSIYEHYFRLIENAGKTQQRHCSEIFLEEWGTSGKVRPNLGILMKLLYDVNLIRAAEAIDSKISKGIIKLFIVMYQMNCIRYCIILFSDYRANKKSSFPNPYDYDGNTVNSSNSEHFRSTVLNTSLTLKDIDR